MNPAKSKYVWQLSFEGAWTTSVAFLGGSNQVAAGNREGQIYIWDLPADPPAEEGKREGEPSDFAPLRRLDGHTNAISHLITADDGKTLISTSLDRTIRIWDMNSSPIGSAEVVLDKSNRQRKARNVPSAERPKILEAPGVKVEVVSTSQVLEGHKEWIKALGISGDGKRIISGDDACLTIVWDLASRKQISSWTGHDRVWVSSAALSPDGKIAFTAEYAGRRSSFDVPAAQARLWNVEDGSMKLDLLKVWSPKTKDEDRGDTYAYGRVWGEFMGRGLVSACFSPDGKLIAAAQGGETSTGKIQLIDVESGKIVRTISGHRSGACDVKFSADGKYVLTSGRDTVVRVLQVEDGKEVATLGKGRGGQFKDWLYSIAISPDQRWVAAADIAGYVQLWRFEA